MALVGAGVQEGVGHSGALEASGAHQCITGCMVALLADGQAGAVYATLQTAGHALQASGVEKEIMQLITRATH